MNDQFVFYNKWASYLIIGGLGPLVAGLGQWAESGTWPPIIAWVCIGAGCLISMATQNLAFFSSAWQTLKDKVNGTPPVPPKS
jgi:hypothetical protein